MAWLESHDTLANHPKTRKLAHLLGISRVTAVGHLHFLWWWAMDYTQDGHLGKFEDLDIAIACEWEGEPGELIDALVRSGFLDVDHKIHDWEEYAGRLIERRRADAERKRASRHGDVQRTSSGHPADGEESPEDGVRNPTIPNQPNPTEPTETNPTTPPARARDKHPADFEAFWKRYPSGHGNKKAAAAQWRNLSVEDRRAAEDGLDKWLRCGRWQRGMVKSGEIWLRDRWWEDEPPEGYAARASPVPSPGPRNVSTQYPSMSPEEVEEWARQNGLA